jgi:tRNA threonylcarbamoyladenosine biosynthesis protein TsaE
VISLQIICQFLVRDEGEMKRWAQQLAPFLQPGDVLALEGDLGAGKTTFAQGLACGLGVEQQVDSPTFTMVKEYPGDLPFYHMDMYRIESVEEELGIEDYLAGQGICLVEWATRIKSLLPEETIWIEIDVQPDGARQVQLKAQHPCRVSYLCKELEKQR